MGYRLLAQSCDSGPCPTFYVGDDGHVKVQGYLTTPPGPLPAGEDVVDIPADAWARLLADLPPGMLLRALATKLHLLRSPAGPVAAKAW